MSITLIASDVISSFSRKSSTSYHVTSGQISTIHGRACFEVHVYTEKKDNMHEFVIKFNKTNTKNHIKSIYICNGKLKSVFKIYKNYLEKGNKDEKSFDMVPKTISLSSNIIKKLQVKGIEIFEPEKDAIKVDIYMDQVVWSKIKKQN